MGGYWDHTRASRQRQPLTNATAPARSCRMGIQVRHWVESNNHKEGTRNMWQQITLQPPMRSILSSGWKKQEHSHQNERRNVLSKPMEGQTQAFLESANMCQYWRAHGFNFLRLPWSERLLSRRSLCICLVGTWGARMI